MRGLFFKLRFHEQEPAIDLLKKVLKSNLKQIESYPTFWGRLSLYENLNKWYKEIVRIESRRSGSSWPKASATFIPEAILDDGSSYSLMVKIENSGLTEAQIQAIN